MPYHLILQLCQYQVLQEKTPNSKAFHKKKCLTGKEDVTNNPGPNYQKQILSRIFYLNSRQIQYTLSCIILSFVNSNASFSESINTSDQGHCFR
jgi:hypothetical protein